MGFSYEQVFGHIFSADEGFIQSWTCISSSTADLIDYFEVYTIACQTYRVELNTFEEAYRHLCNQKIDSKSELIEIVCLKMQNKIYRLIDKDNIDISIQKELKTIVACIDEIYELL